MTSVPWSSGSEPVHFDVPPGSVDCHHHIYDVRFPYDDAASLRPPPATVADYRQLQRRLGTTRNIVVQPSTYGTDNRCLRDALAAFGDAARGIAVIDDRVTPAQLRELDEAGVRGIRFNLSRPAGAGIELLEMLARRVAPLGWHVQLHAMGDKYLLLAERLRALPVPVVIDHLGRIPRPGSLHHPAWDVLRHLVDGGRTWIKLSGAYHDSLDGPPDYADSGPITTAWLRHAPERVVWGTDWPHSGALAGEKAVPDDARLLDLLHEWLPGKELLRQVLVDNPGRLYGFAPPAVAD